MKIKKNQIQRHKTKKNQTIKILLVGDSYIGKSTMVNILRGKDIVKYSPTIFDNFYHYADVGNHKYELDIRDTSGAPEYFNLLKTHLQNVDLVLICYSVNDRDSFDNVESYWYPKMSDLPILLVGLKIDLRYEQKVNDTQKIITYEEGEELANKLGCHFLEFYQSQNEIETQKTIKYFLQNTIDIFKENSEFENMKSKSNKNCQIL